MSRKTNTRPWDRKKLLLIALCLLLPILPWILFESTQLLSLAQFTYIELGLQAALLCGIVVTVRQLWSVLLAAQLFVAIALIPRLFFPVIAGVADLTLTQMLILLAVPCLFVGVVLVAKVCVARRGGALPASFNWTTCLAALALHALLLPYMLGEPLRSRIIHIANPGQEIIETSRDGTLVLTHTALTPVNVTLFTYREGRLDVIRKETLSGYPVGIRVREDHALIALRETDNSGKVQRIDFVRLSASGIRPVNSYTCTVYENPPHTVNNIAPDGSLLALADGAFVDVVSGTRVDLLPPETTDGGHLTFVQWVEETGQAAFYQHRGSELILFHPATSTLERHRLRGRPNPLHTLSILPGGGHVWYEELGLFNWQRAVVENLTDRTRVNLSRREGKARDGSVLLWTGERRLTYVTALGALDSVVIDRERNRYYRVRHTQLLDMTTDVTFAQESGWLFWVTQSPYGPGTAIHGLQVSGTSGTGGTR